MGVHRHSSLEDTHCAVYKYICGVSYREGRDPQGGPALPEGGAREVSHEELMAIKAMLPIECRDATERCGVRGARKERERRWGQEQKPAGLNPRTK